MMSEQHDFERAWLAKLSSCLDEIAGEGIRKQVMKESEELSSQSSRQVVIEWSKRAMERLDSLVDEQERKEIMTGCACQYPRSGLQRIRKKYEETKDIDLAHQMLQERFESFLKNSLELDDQLIEEIAGKGWGLAGLRKGSTIMTTKIPKSGHLVEYMQETDPARKRRYYCHCPRVRDAVAASETISPTYCYCGAGFYRGIWDEILQKPVDVEVLQTVLAGDEICKIAVHLPPDQ